MCNPVGGVYIPILQVVLQVGAIHIIFRSGRYFNFCGGVLITSRHVLTVRYILENKIKNSQYSEGRERELNE